MLETGCLLLLTLLSATLTTAALPLEGRTLGLVVALVFPAAALLVALLVLQTLGELCAKRRRCGSFKACTTRCEGWLKALKRWRRPGKRGNQPGYSRELLELDDG